MCPLELVATPATSPKETFSGQLEEVRHGAIRDFRRRRFLGACGGREQGDESYGQALHDSLLFGTLSI